MLINIILQEHDAIRGVALISGKGKFFNGNHLNQLPGLCHPAGSAKFLI
jgi:hypothetical protein